MQQQQQQKQNFSVKKKREMLSEISKAYEARKILMKNYVFVSVFEILQQPSVTREVTRYMEPGHWFISLYNDDGDEQEITFYAAVADDMTQNCPNGCSGNGQCLLGHCQCNPGFGGDDCSESK